VAKPPEMRTWVPWSELVQEPRGTLDEFHALLRKYPRSSPLRICSRLSVFFNYGPDASTTAKEDTVAFWIPALFLPLLVRRVQSLLAKKRIIFLQAQLRYLAAETIRLKEPQRDPYMSFWGSVFEDFASLRDPSIRATKRHSRSQKMQRWIAESDCRHFKT